MSHLESLISRYLDGELKPAELQELRQRLDESPEARSLLWEMTAVTRSARGIPSLDAPSPSLEARLFHRLEAEGLGSGKRPAPAATASATTARSIPSRSRIPGRPAMALLLILFSLTTSYWLSEQADPVDASIANRVDRFDTAPLPEAGFQQGDAAPRITAPLAADLARAPIVPRVSVTKAPARKPATDRRQENGMRNNRNENTPILLPELEPEQPLLPIIPTQEDTNPALTQNQTSVPEVTPPAYIPPVERAIERPSPGKEGIFAASFRPTGVSFSDNEAMPDLSLRLDARVGERHQVSFIVGRSALRSEQRATALLSMSPAMASDGNGGPSFGKRNAQETTKIELENETWGGVGYSYSLMKLGPVEAALGVKAGAGPKSMRLGLEGAVRVSVSKVIAFEAVPTLTHVIPHHQSSSMSMIQDASTGTLSFSQSKHSTFTATGLEVGVRISLQ